jgi:phosphoribosylanthranilate isomerase
VVEFVSARRFVKICGVTNIDDARHIRDVGADALGLVFAQSKRHVEVAQARDIVAASEGIWHVGVFRNVEPSSIYEAVDTTGIDIVQIHGPLDPLLLEGLRARRRGVIKALSVGTDEFTSFDESSVDAILIDGIEPGSGHTHSWHELESRHFGVPVIAAGGLKLENVAEVIREVHPWGVDIATGVESSPGIKNLSQVTRFVELAGLELGKGEST